MHIYIYIYVCIYIYVSSYTYLYIHMSCVYAYIHTECSFPKSARRSVLSEECFLAKACSRKNRFRRAFLQQQKNALAFFYKNSLLFCERSSVQRSFAQVCSQESRIAFHSFLKSRQALLFLKYTFALLQVCSKNRDSSARVLLVTDNCWAKRPVNTAR